MAPNESESVYDATATVTRLAAQLWVLAFRGVTEPTRPSLAPGAFPNLNQSQSLTLFLLLRLVALFDTCSIKHFTGPKN